MSSLDDPEQHAASALERASAAHGEGDLAAAEDAYRAAVEEGDPEAAFQLGVILGDRGDSAAAADAYERAVAAGHPEAMLNLAFLYWEVLGREEDARALLASGIARGDRRAMFDLGYLLWSQGEHEGAAAAFRSAIEAGDPRGHLEMGFLLADEERHEEALAAFEAAASMGVGEALTQAGWQLARLGRLAEAEAALRRAHELGHRAGDGILADVLDELGRRSEADAVRTAAAEWARNSVSIEYRDVMADLDGEDLDAEGLAEWVAEAGDGEVPTELAALLYDAARLAEVETRLRLAIEYGDDSARQKLAQVLRLTGRASDADELLAAGR